MVETLKEIYGRNKSTKIASTKQLPDESARVYLGRLKANFSILGINLDNLTSDLFSINSETNKLRLQNINLSFIRIHFLIDKLRNVYKKMFGPL